VYRQICGEAKSVNDSYIAAWSGNINELRRLIASFDNADGTLHHLNKIENILYLKNIKNVKQRKIDEFLE